jgi:tRNA(Ile)-lysidine synthetase-like protein
MSYEILYTEWFANQQYWFTNQSNYDQYLSNKYKHLFDEPINIESNKETIIAGIILNDQIIRHIARADNTVNLNCSFSQTAIKLSTHVLHVFDTLNIQELSFVLLPFRHTKNLGDNHYAINEMWNFIKSRDLDSSSLEFAKRFLTASYKNSPLNDTNSILNFLKNDFNELDYDLVIDKRIKEYSNFDPSQIESAIKDTIINILDQADKADKADKADQADKADKADKACPIIIISLSMGVDSAICAYILSKLRAKYNFNLIAVHINYCNREHSMIEEAFVRKYCSSVEIPCYIRRIPEINRADCMKYNLRDIYELYTRNVRFDTYKQVYERSKLAYSLDNRKPIVILGHNKNDCFENIITNITYQQKYENLNGMQYKEEQDAITFYRPLLGVTKEDIRSYAHLNNISHLKNSTPAWSMRGKIRDNVRPALEQWDSRSIDGLFKLSEITRKLYVIIDKSIADIFNRMIKTKVNEYYFECDTCDITCEIFWSRFFIRFNTLTKLPMVSHKSIASLMERLTHANANARVNVQISKYIRLVYTDNTVSLFCREN